MPFIKRKILSEIQPYLSKREIIVLTGMRRVGKTSVLKELYKKIKSENKIFLDFDNIVDQQLFEVKDFRHIWDNLNAYNLTDKRKAWIFIDEIQNFPVSVKAIKYLYDHYDVKFIVSGSSSFYLKNLFPESLSGRKIIFEMFPLDFEEFLWFKNVKIKFNVSFKSKAEKKNIALNTRLHNYVDEYIEWGGFPQVALIKNKEHKRKIIGDIFSSYYQKDVIQLTDFKNLNTFKNLIMLLIERTGSKVDISKLASETKVSRETIYSYLSFLEATYFVSLIPAYSKSIDRIISKQKKVYICDNGFLNVFAKPSEGSLLENSVYLQLRHYDNIKYYQKKSGHEIDFILPGKNISVEVKKRANIIDYKKLVSYSKQTGITESYIVSLEYSDEKWCIPFEMI